MTIRTKTREFPFDTLTGTLATATTHTFASKTLHIPENASRTFRSAVLVFTVMDAQATAFSTTAITAGITLGAAGASNQAFTSNPTLNSGEHKTLPLTRNVTAYFNTNFGAGTSQTCACTYINTGGTVNNLSAKLIVTYEWDDAAQTTRSKTARIPIESTVGALTATLANIGTSQIPALDTLLPEASKVYRDIWFEIEGNDYSLGPTNDPTLNFRIDAGGTTHSSGAFFTDLASARSFRYIWNIGTSGFTTNAAHDLQLSASTVTAASTFNHLSIVLCVNYEYDHSASTRCLSSLRIVGESIDFPGATAAADETRTVIEFYIEEPGTITLVQSGVQCFYTAADAISPTLDIGTQAARTYTDAALLYCGNTGLMQRIDSGSALGAAITLQRGKNQLTINSRAASITTSPTGMQFILLLNYTSDKSAQGDGAHNHSNYWHIADQYTVAASVGRYIAALAAVNIPETDYYLNNVATQLDTVLGNPGAGMVSVGCELAAGELEGDGWSRSARSAYAAESEIGWWRFTDSVNEVFKKYPTDPATKANIETSRRWRIMSSHAGYSSLGLWTTYHSITFTAAGDISNSAGGTVNIGLHRASDGALLGTTSRTGNGAYSFTYYDNTENYFTEAVESGTLLGRSDNGTLAGSP